VKKHTVKHKDGGLIEIDNLTRGKAITLFCTECMGWETHPKYCTAPTCPLFPYRRKTLKTVVRKSGGGSYESNNESKIDDL